MGTATLTIGGMGFTAYQGLKDVEVAALCDVDTGLFAGRVKKHFTDKNLCEPKLYDDMRKLFGNKDIDAIRADDRFKLTAPVEEGFYSCAPIHLANISYRLGRTLYIDPVKFEVKNDLEANGMFSKQYRTPYVLPVI